MRRRWGPLLLIFLGVAVRLLLHDLHGLEGDDAFSLSLSQTTPTGDLIRGLMRLELDVHPPLHFLLLKIWTGTAGASLLALRLLNVLLDALTGALMWRLTRDVGGSRWTAAGVLALWAVSPLLIFGTWLVRMYALLGALVMFTAAATVRAARVDSRFTAWAALAAAASLAAMYTHILGAVIAGAAALPLLIIGWRRGWRGFVGVAGAFGLVGALYLPFALAALTLAQSVETLGAEVNPAQTANLSAWAAAGQTVWAAVFHRLDVPTGVLLWAGVAFIALALATVRRDKRGNTLAALGLVTFVGAGVLAATLGFKPRYGVPFAGLWLVVIVVGMARVRVQWLGVPLLAAGMVWGLAQNTERGWRDDWVGLADYVETYTVPGDAVLVVPDWGQEAMRYHYDGGAPVRGFFPALTPALDLDAAFGQYVRDHERVWLVRYQPEISDPEGLAPAWLAARGATVAQAFPAGAAVILYDMRPVDDALPAHARPLDAQFGDALALRGVTLPDGLTTPAEDTRLYDASGRVLVALHWEALRAAPDVTPRVRLTDTFGQVYGGALPAPDGVLAERPPRTWTPGEVVTVYDALNVNPTTPPGVYNIEVMVLDAAENPLPATGADTGQQWVIAGQVVITD